MRNSRSSKSRALSKISKVLIENGKDEKGEKTIEESLEVAKSISDESKKSKVLLEISKVLIENGKESCEGEKVLEELLEVVKSISDENWKSRTLFEISKSIDRVWKRGRRREDFRRIVRSRKIYK